MPLPYTGSHGELNFEEDIIELLKTTGWENKVLKNCTVDDLIQNWRQIIFERNRTRLNSIPLSDEEMQQVLDAVKQQANSPVKANRFINTANRGVAIKRDKTSEDVVHAGKEVYLDLFQAREIAGGTSRYQIAEQVQFISKNDNYPDRRGDITLLIDGMPVVHIELKASGVDVFEACTQIQKYTQEGVFNGFMSLVQIFWAITPEDALYFSNPGDKDKFNPAFYFRWGDRDNNIIKDWKELIIGENHILSVPEAHKMVGYYSVGDTNADVLKVSRSYQYTAIKEIVKRTANQSWGCKDQKGGFVWCTTGGGKTLTSFKAGQLIIDLNLADKVVFVVDRKTLDEQSYNEYKSFQRDGESIAQTTSSMNLFNILKSNKADNALVLTSIQKLSNINEESEHIEKTTLDVVAQKRIVFIIDEAHRSQFGIMHESVKRTFYNALFFGFTGTPIMSQNMKPGEQTTESVFGNCLAVYSLATGIRDRNVLGFWPQYVKTFNDLDVREAIALNEAKAKSADDLVPGSDEFKIYQYYKQEAPMVTEYNKEGKVVEKGIEDFLSNADFGEEHRKAVVKNIIENYKTIAYGTKGTLFHSILATNSIKEACSYWEIFHKEAPNLNVTALFDPNINANTEDVIEKEEALVKIVSKYNEDFGTSFNRKTDPHFADFKSDLMARIAHKKPYQFIGSDHKKCLDIVIVVDQLLTGFDSAYVNVLYVDKMLESDALIQAISRTNRIYDNDEKPWGMVKFYRRPETMARNLDEALKMYCQGDARGVQEVELKDNIRKLNELYDEICVVFSHDNIENFVKIPSSDADRQKFRKDFCEMKRTLRAAILQGFKWTNEFADDLDFDEEIYKTLYIRFHELPGGGPRPPIQPKAGYGIDTNINVLQGEKINSDYLESRFRILTISDIEKKYKNNKKETKEDIIKDIKAHIGLLEQNLQKFAIQVLEDIENDKLVPSEDKRFMDYIQEYRERRIRKEISKEAAKYGVNEDLFIEIYSYHTDSRDVDQIELQKLEDTASEDKLKAYYNLSLFASRRKMHSDLSCYIKNRMAEKE